MHFPNALWPNHYPYCGDWGCWQTPWLCHWELKSTGLPMTGLAWGWLTTRARNRVPWPSRLHLWGTDNFHLLESWATRKEVYPSPAGRHGEDSSTVQPSRSPQPAQSICEAVLDILNQTGSQSPIWHHVKQKKCAVEPSLNPWPSKLWDIIKWNCFKTIWLGCGFKF